MRLDRLLTLHFFGSVIGTSRQASDLKIPILMYHSIARDVEDNVHPYYRTVTTPETFKMHLEFLNQAGYEVLTLSEAVRLLQGVSDQVIHPPLMASELRKSTDSLRRPVVITFDDGFQDFYTTAFPILERFGFKATVFLSSGFIDKTFLNGRECLRGGEIRELAEKGIEFGSHTINHPQLKRLSNDEIVHELAGSKASIEDITGSKVSLFSYPYSFPEEDVAFVRKLGDLLIEQGYSAGVTTIIGLSRGGDTPLFLRRLPMNDCDDGLFLRAKLNGDYDWLQKGQLAYKRLRAMHMNSIAL
jgi:peptidoglycan/xylan/chitin deacetylase (PgdA/CDA1 family)